MKPSSSNKNFAKLSFLALSVLLCHRALGQSVRAPSTYSLSIGLAMETCTTTSGDVNCDVGKFTFQNQVFALSNCGADGKGNTSCFGGWMGSQSFPGNITFDAYVSITQTIDKSGAISYLTSGSAFNAKSTEQYPLLATESTHPELTDTVYLTGQPWQQSPTDQVSYRPILMIGPASKGTTLSPSLVHRLNMLASMHAAQLQQQKGKVPNS